MCGNWMCGERSRACSGDARRTHGICGRRTDVVFTVWCREENFLRGWLHLYGPEYPRFVSGFHCIFRWGGGALGWFHTTLVWTHGPIMSVRTIETSLKLVRNLLSISDGGWINISKHPNRKKLYIYKEKENFNIKLLKMWAVSEKTCSGQTMLLPTISLTEPRRVRHDFQSHTCHFVCFCRIHFDQSKSYNKN